MSKNISEDIDKKIASIVRKELKNENYDDECWLKAFKKADGDEKKAKAFYIDFRTNDLKKQTEKEKIADDLKTNSHVQCGRSFCVNRYQILLIPKKSIGVQLCEGCGNTLDQKVNEKSALRDIEHQQLKTTENKNTTIKNQSVKVQQNLVERIWWGNETLSNTFWMYCVLTQLVVGIISGLLLNVVGVIIIVIPAAVFIWSNTGLWRCSEKYKLSQLKINQSFGWATAAKVYVVLSYIITLSRIGLILPKNF